MFRLLKSVTTHLWEDEDFWLALHGTMLVVAKNLKPHTKWDEYEADFRMYDEFANRRSRRTSR